MNIDLLAYPNLLQAPDILAIAKRARVNNTIRILDKCKQYIETDAALGEYSSTFHLDKMPGEPEALSHLESLGYIVERQPEKRKVTISWGKD